MNGAPKHAEMLGEKMKQSDVRVWLINTGWSGGEYGVGERMKLKYTRSMITAALNGDLDNVAYKSQDVFGLLMPVTCPGVEDEILDPKNTWTDKAGYETKANKLATGFIQNFEKFKEDATSEILEAAPVPSTVNV